MATSLSEEFKIKPLELFKPPLMSFVLINWNYGRYVGAAIDFIKAQNYPCVEYLVVDNGSTDES